MTPTNDLPNLEADDLDSPSHQVEPNEPWPLAPTLLATGAAAVAMYAALRYYSRDSVAISTASDLCWYALWFAILCYVTFDTARFARRIVNAFWMTAVLLVSKLVIKLLLIEPQDSFDLPERNAMFQEMAVQDFLWFSCLVPFKLLIGCLFLAPLRAIWKWRIVRIAGGEVSPERKLSMADCLTGLMFAAAVCGGLRYVLSLGDNSASIPEILIPEAVVGLIALIAMPPLLWWLLRTRRLEDRLGIAIVYELGVVLVLAVLLQIGQRQGVAGIADFAPFLVLPATLITLAYIARRAGYRLAIGNDPQQFARCNSTAAQPESPA